MKILEYESPSPIRHGRARNRGWALHAYACSSTCRTVLVHEFSTDPASQATRDSSWQMANGKWQISTIARVEISDMRMRVHRPAAKIRCTVHPELRGSIHCACVKEPQISSSVLHPVTRRSATIPSRHSDTKRLRFI